jgi:hypothetical protein
MSGNLKLSFTVEAVDRATGPIMAIRRTIERLAAPAARVRDAFAGVMAGVGAATRGVAAAGVAVSGVAFGLRRVATSVDHIADAAASLGMSVQLLQKLGYAAQQNGSSLDEMSQSLVFMNKNMAEARGGNAEMIEWLKRAGVTSANLRDENFTAADALMAMADKFQHVGNVGANSQRKVAVSTALLGRQGFKMIQLMNGGREAFEALFVEADRLGITLSNDTVKALGEFNDGLDRLGAIAFSYVARGAARLAPVITNIVEKFAEWAAANHRVVSAKVGAFIDRIQRALPGFLEGTEKVWTMFKRLATGADDLSAALGGWPNMIAVLSGLIGAQMVLSVYALATSLGVLTAAVWANPLTWVLATVVALVAALPLLVLQWDKVIEKLYQLDNASPAWLRVVTAPALQVISKFASGPKPEGSWQPQPEGTWETSPLRPDGVVAPYSAFPSKAERFDLGGVLSIKIDGDGKPKVASLVKKPGGLLDYSVDTGQNMVGW